MLNLNSINRKLLVTVLLFSSIITTVITALSLYFQYRDEQNALEASISRINRITVNSLVTSLWTINNEQIEIQLRGLLSTKEIIRAQIKDAEGKEIHGIGKVNKSYTFTRTIAYPLNYKSGEIEEHLGTLFINVTEDYIYDKLKSELVRVFILQGLKTLLISFILLYMFGRIVTGRIIKIDKYFTDFDLDKPDRLKSPEKYLLTTPDEIDHLADSINEMMNSTIKYNQKIIELKNEAVSVSESKSQFLASMSHDLRTPLNAILGVTEYLREQNINEDTNSSLDLQKHAGMSLLYLINDILDFSKIEADQLNISKSNFNVKATIDLCAQITAKGVGANNNNLMINISEDVPYSLHGDELRLKQIIINLLTNAGKFTNNGEIVLSLKENDTNMKGNYLFTIKDTGIGIPSEDLKDIYSPFKQADNNDKKSSGTGLGLAICKKVSELLGGEIKIISQLGAGTLVQFTMQLEPAYIEDEEEPAFQQQTASYNIVDKHNILIVEDDPDNRQIIKLFLKNSGHSLTFATNGKEGVENYIMGNFNIILMDIQMPIMDGYEAIKQIRAHEQEKKLPKSKIVALTAFTAENDIKKCFESGCDEYASKPINKKTLLNHLKIKKAA